MKLFLVFFFLIATSGHANTVKCLDKKSCPSALAKIIGSEKGESWKCTGFLVTDKILATNRHCLPENLVKNDNKDCSKSIDVFFPETSEAPALNVKCAKLLEASKTAEDKNVVALDYAFLELEKAVARTPFVISHAGVADQEELTFWRVDEIKNSVIKKDKCISSYGSLFFPFTDSHDDPVMTLVGCSADHGNSGSPLLNSKGEVVAILEGKSNQAGMDFFKNKFKEKNLINIIKSANLACINVPGASTVAVPEACKVVKTDEDFFRDGNALLENQVKQQLKTKSEAKFGVQFSENVVYQSDYAPTKMRRNNFASALKPECIKDLAEMKKQALGLKGGEDQKYFSVMDLEKRELCLVDFTFTKNMNVKKINNKCKPYQVYLLLDLRSDSEVPYYLTFMDVKTNELTAFSEDKITSCK